MKNKALLLLGLVTALLAGMCWYQFRRLSERQTQVAVLRSQTEEQSQQVDELKASKEHLNRERHELLKEATEQAAQLSQQPAKTSAANGPTPAESGEAVKPGADAAGFGKFISKMMADPDMKKIIQDQQRTMMEQLYAPMIKQMGLTAEQGDKFKDLMTANAMKGAEKATSLFGGDTGTNRTEMLNTLAAEHQTSEDKIKELLGDTRYAQYQQYQQTANDRMQLNLFKQQVGAGELALTDQQTEQLLNYMREEKQVLAAAGQPLPGTGHDPATLQAMVSEDQSEMLVQSQENVNQRVYERAKDLLSPEQLNAFAKFQTNQTQMLRMGLTMARKMMPPDKP